MQVSLEKEKQTKIYWVNVNAGKIQCNKVEKAMNDLNFLHKTRIELTNYMDSKTGEIKEERTELVDIFGTQINPKIREIEERIGKRYDWKVTKNNAKNIETAFRKAYKEAYQYVPVIDKRKTKEELEEIIKERKKKYDEMQKKEAEKDKLRQRFNPNNRLILVHEAYDASDIMTDYYEPNRTIRTYILKEIPQGRRDLRILKREIQKYPSLRKLTWKEHRENYSMCRFGYALESNEIVGKTTVDGKEVSYFYVVDFGYISWDGHCPMFPEKPEEPKSKGKTIEKSKDIEIKKEGSWTWVYGKTYEIKEKLKEQGFRWSARRKAWYNTQGAIPTF